MGSAISVENSTAVGFGALGALLTANVVTGVGYAAGGNSTGSENVFVGYSSGGDVTSGTNGVYIGSRSARDGSADITGAGNIVIGYSAANNMTGAAAKNIAIGENIQMPTANGSNQIVIGNLIFGTGASGTGTTIPAGSRVGIRTSAPARALHVSGVVRLDSVTQFAPTKPIGVDANGDIGAWTMSVLADSIDNYIVTSGISDGDKGDVDVTSSGTVWTVDTNAVTTVKITDGAVTSAKLADQSAGGSKLGALTYIPVDDADINLSSYLAVDWISGYSQLVVWLRIGTTATRTVTLPTPASGYAGKIVEIFFGDTTSDSFYGQITSATNRITYRDGNTVSTATTYDGGQNMKYAKVMCMQDPSTLAYQWVIIDNRL